MTKAIDTLSDWQTHGTDREWSISQHLPGVIVLHLREGNVNVQRAITMEMIRDSIVDVLDKGAEVVVSMMERREKPEEGAVQ